MRMRAPTTPSCCGVEPAFHLDMLSSDELAGQGVSLLPAATPPSVNQGLVLNGTTQYASVRNNIILPAVLTYYMEFAPTFNYTANALYIAQDGDAAGTRFGWYKHDNANLNRIIFMYAGGTPAFTNGADYGAYWRQNQRNKLCCRMMSGACVTYLNGNALVTNNAGYSLGVNPDRIFIGATYLGTAPFPGTIYDVRIYTRYLTVAEAIELTTLT